MSSVWRPIRAACCTWWSRWGFPSTTCTRICAWLDYHEYATVKRHADWTTFLAAENPATDRLVALTTRATQNVFDARFELGDYWVFGSETKGLSDAVHQSFTPATAIKLPMLAGQRSLNLSNAVAMTVFEA